MTEPRTIKDWENEVATLTNQELEDYEKALETLKTWENFEKAFGPSKSLACLRQIIGCTKTIRTVTTIADAITKSAAAPAEPKIFNGVKVEKTTLGDWNNGRTSSTSNCYYTGKTACWGVWIHDVKTIAFSRKCDAKYFEQFVMDTGYVDSGDPEWMFCKWLKENRIVDPTSKIGNLYNLDKVKVVG